MKLVLAHIHYSKKHITKENYEALHPTGPKSDYAYHTEAMDRAMQGGIDDVGIGVLYGLEHYKYDFCWIVDAR